MGEKRRRYTKEFKKDSVELLLRTGKPAITIAAELGIRSELLSRWKREYEIHDEKAFPGHGNPIEAELAKLRKELADVKMERDILKKAVSIFSRESK
jgi:transposase